MYKLTRLDKKIIYELSGDLPIAINPYGIIAQKLGINESILLKKIKEFKKKGLIRRFGATLAHRMAGFSANSMAVWYVPEEQARKVGRIMAEFPQVSHCYERPLSPEWHYNLYTMLHAKSRKACRKIAQEISRKTGIKDYRLLYSTKEFKKTSMRYFNEDV